MADEHAQAPAYSRISPTTRLTARWRARAAIPYFAEIAAAAGAREAAAALVAGSPPPLAAVTVPLMEARYLSVNHGLRAAATLSSLAALEPQARAVVSTSWLPAGYGCSGRRRTSGTNGKEQTSLAAPRGEGRLPRMSGPFCSPRPKITAGLSEKPFLGVLLHDFPVPPMQDGRIQNP